MYVFLLCGSHERDQHRNKTNREKKENSSSNLGWKKVIMEVDCLVNYEAEK